MTGGILVPKELIKEHAKKLSANAVLIYISLLEHQGNSYIIDDMNLITISKRQIEEFTGIAPNKQNQYIKELERQRLLDELSDYQIEDLFEEYDDDYFMCNPYDKVFDIKLDIDNCEGGFEEVPKEILILNSLEVNGETIKIKAQHKLLYILHLILSQRKGYSYAGREYLAETLGICVRTITNLNNTLEQAGLLVKVPTLTPLGNEGVRTNNKYYLMYKPLPTGDINRYYQGLPTYRPIDEIKEVIQEREKYDRKF